MSSLSGHGEALSRRNPFARLLGDGCGRRPALPCRRRAGYGDEILNQFIARKRQHHMFPVSDASFVAGLQNAADWLTDRKALPDHIIVADYLALA